MRLAVVSVFVLGVGVMHDDRETRAPRSGRPWQNLEVSVRVAEGGDGPAGDVQLDSDGL